MIGMSTKREDRRDAMIRLLDATEQLPAATTLRTRSYDLLALPPGGRVVDVGCGTGRAAAELHARGANVTGLDVDEHILGLARERWPWLDFRVADAGALPLEDASVAGYRADKVLHSVPDPEAAVREAHRVLAPGGRIVVVGQDWDVLVVDSDDPELTRTMTRARAETIPHPRIARSSRNLLLDTGFVDVAVEVHTLVFTDPAMLPVVANVATTAAREGAVGEAEAAEWIAEQTLRAKADRLFLATPMFLVSGRRT